MRALLSIISLLFVLGSPMLNAQLVNEIETEQEKPAAVQPVIREIDLKFEGARNVSDQAVFAHVRLREGDEYNQELVDRSIRSLYETGLYEFIEVRRDPAPGNQIDLNFIIVAKYKIQSISFEGNEAFSDNRLRDKIEIIPGMPVDEVRIKADSDAIFEYYQDKGYSLAEVDYNIVRDDVEGIAQVTFLISEGRKLRITDIEFEGNEAFDDGELRDVIETAEHVFLLSILTGSGKFNEEEFQSDLEKLRQFYKNNGYLDVEVPESQIKFDYPDQDELAITITVQEGRQYQLGDVRVEGNTLYSSETIYEAMTLETGETFSPGKVDENLEIVKDVYGRDGYLDTFVVAKRIPNLDTGRIDLVLAITEGDQYFLESINISGNTKTKSVVIVRELALEPGDVFDTVRMKTSENRLRNTRLFEQRGGVSLMPEPTNIPGRRDLRIQVEEARTGNITFGAGFSSVEDITVYAELTQSNFDIFNYRSMFQGDGQKFRLRFSVGTESNQILLSFEEPWVFERRLAFGFEVFRTETDYNSALYNELRTGFELYLRKRLFELVNGKLSYRLEAVDIFDVDAGANPEIKKEEGGSSVSTVALTFTRDTRDNLLVTTSGSRMEYTTAVSGGPLLGQTDYLRNEVRGGKWWTLHPYHTQVLQLVGRTGTLTPFGDSDDVPFFDRYFLGGPYSLRGFDYREVGPQNAGQEVGGHTYGYGSLEYSVEIVDPVRFATFYDWGFVNRGDADWDFSDYSDNWGVGLRIMIMGAPLRLDLGFPITDGSNVDSGSQFHFSFGTTY